MSVYTSVTQSGTGGSIGVTVTGPALFAPGADASGLVQAALADAAAQAGQEALATSQAAYSPREIREGWGLAVEQAADWHRIALTQTAPLWTFVEFPTGPHDITAHAGGVLAWTDGGGGTHFAKRVHHPGTPGKDRLPAQEAALLKALTQAVDTRLAPLLGGG